MTNRRDIGIIVCGHVGIGCTVLAEMMHRYNMMESEIIIINGAQEEPKKEFEFRNKTPIDIIQVIDCPVDLFSLEPRIYGRQTKFKNNYLNSKKKYKSIRRNDRIIK